MVVLIHPRIHQSCSRWWAGQPRCCRLPAAAGSHVAADPEPHLCHQWSDGLAAARNELRADSSIGDQLRRTAPAVSWLALASITIAAVAGMWWAMDQQLGVLWMEWTTDPLRSIGILVPPTSLLLCLRAWRGRRWRTADGSWWGLGLVALSFLITRVQIAMLLPSGGMIAVFPGLLIWMFVSGVVVLFGGIAAWRLAALPLALLLFVNPVPNFFANAIDLPLQHVAARVTRDLAAALGMTLTGTRLQLMFAPSLGMFIAPGCNGLRGAVAMGYLALVVGYLYQLRPALHALYVTSAVLLAYVFNLVRLCSLVVCYWLALRVPQLAGHMTAADYAVGASLFFMAGLFLFQVPRLKV
jgi:exosortase J